MSEAELLSEAEHRAMDLTAQLWNVLAREVVTEGPTQQADLGELSQHVHAIQHLVLAQAAARAYPDRYRLLGGQLPTVVQCEDDEVDDCPPARVSA